jgi:septum formation protein
MRLILASTSRIRSELLGKAGLAFEALRPDVDENALKIKARHLSPSHLAQSLAASKAISVASRWSEAVVIGADQVLNLAGKAFDKPASRDEARRQLLQLRGRSHVLETAICCAKDNKVVWEYLGRATLKMRDFTESFLDDYLDHVGEDVTSSVGGYKLEGRGAQLFETIDGDYFTILGLPLLPLLDFLRRQGALAA